MSGWIKIHRDILYHEIWSDKPFSKGQAWIDLILMANHSDNWMESSARLKNQHTKGSVQACGD